MLRMIRIPDTFSIASLQPLNLSFSFILFRVHFSVPILKSNFEQDGVGFCTISEKMYGVFTYL